MTFGLTEVIVFLALAGVVAAIGVGLGIFFVAPRLSRMADRNDEDTGAGTD